MGRIERCTQGFTLLWIPHRQQWFWTFGSVPWGTVVPPAGILSISLGIAAQRHQLAVRTWWHGGPQLDAKVSSKFGDLLVSVAANPNPPTVVAQSRRDLAEEVLAQVIVLSQFSRHILPRGRLDNPGTSEEYDLHARRLANWAIAEGLHKELRHYEKSFLYMPFIQSEDLVDQDRACQLFKDQHNQAIDEGRRAPGSVSPGAAWMTCRRNVVARFGRLPFRNDQLGRESTPEELAYLSRWS